MKCKLCLQDKELLESHLIPTFIVKWLKATSPSPFLRSVVEPNKRKQDLFKEKLLCSGCEQQLGRYENYFAKNIFYPFINNNQQTFTYDEKLKKFMVSVQWRMGLFALKKASLVQRYLLNRFLDSARSYLTSGLKDILYEQHVFFLGEVKDIPPDVVPPRFHQYLWRSVDSTIVSDAKKRLIPRRFFHFVKLPHMALVTFIRPTFNDDWIGTKVEDCGVINAKQEIRDGAFGEFLLNRAGLANNDFQSNVSENQMKRIIETATKDPDKFVKSATFKAWKADKKIVSKYK